MQDYSDNALDRLIGRSLRSGTVVRPEQTRRAWDALQTRIAADNLAAAKPAQERTSLLRSFGRWLIWMCLDDGHYERAMRRRLNAYPLALAGDPLGVGLWAGRLHHLPI